MPLASLTFLTPQAAVIALAVFVPLAGLAVGERRVRRARAILGLSPPSGNGPRTAALALAAVPALLGVAAAQPALHSLQGVRTRSDAQALFVLDTSRSMAAAARPGGTTRLARAQADAVRLRAAIPDVPAGVATLTDRILPDLFPTPDRAAFDSTVGDAVGIERPPPQQASVTATTFAPLASVADEGYFAPSARRRLLVVLTDGESQPFSAAAVARALRSGPGVSLLLVHVWHGDERVYGAGGRPEPAYRPDERSGDTLASLAAATGGRAFDEGALDGAEAAIRAAAGSGPTVTRGLAPHTTPLAPYVAAAAFVPLLLVLRRRNVA